MLELSDRTVQMCVAAAFVLAACAFLAWLQRSGGEP